MQAAFDNSVLRRVVLVIEQSTHAEELSVSARTRLTEDLELGRFGRLRLGMCLEEAFDLELPDDVLARFITVGDVASYLSKRYFRDIAAVSTSKTNARATVE